MKKHILIIRMSAMGDVAMTAPVIKAFASKYPETKITLVSRVFFKPLFKEIPNLNFFEVDLKKRHKGILGIYRLSKDLLKLNIDFIADLHYVLRSRILCIFMSSSVQQISQLDKARDEKKELTRETNKTWKPLRSMHLRYADVFSNLGMPLIINKKSNLKKQDINNNMTDVLGNKNDKKWIGIAPFAFYKTKSYPFEKIEKLIELLSANNQYQIILFGGGKDQKTKMDILSDKFTNVYTFCGIISFPDELKLISNLDIMLSMDSANGHFSAMYGVPTVTVWGLTHPYCGFTPFMQPIENSITPDRKIFPQLPNSTHGNKEFEGFEKVWDTIKVETIYDKVVSLLK